jgi:hypothetical protein
MPEMDTVPVPVGAVPLGGTTVGAPTDTGTAPLPEAPAGTSVPVVRTIGQFPPRDGAVSTLNVRVAGGFVCAASVLMLVSVFLPWSSDAGAQSHAGAEFRSGALVAIEAVVLFLFGLRLWRTRRRWVASLVALAATLFGLAGIGLAMYELVRLGDPSNAQGLYLLLGANLLAAVAGFRAQARLSMARRQQRYPSLRAV